MIEIWSWLHKALSSFYREFSRDSTYKWFVVVIAAFMVRTDASGVTGFIRDLNLDPALYETFIHFFHADSYMLQRLQEVWMQVAASSGCLYRDEGLVVFIIDGIKQLKEGSKTPGVKKLHQESENSGKAPYIFGHHYGVLGILIGDLKKLFCTPLTASIQDGVDIIRKWESHEYESKSHVVLMILEACRATAIYGVAILLADSYFLSRPALRAWLAYEKKTGKRLLSIITRATPSNVAYTKPETPERRKPGRPRIIGEKASLQDFFTRLGMFTEVEMTLYGKTERIRYACLDLLWGEGLYQELRFVYILREGIAKPTILVCTNLLFAPERIIRLYGYRFKIEVAFRAMKQQIRSFFSHFWSKSMPKLNKKATRDEPDPLEAITNEKDQKNIIRCLKAIESYAQFGCIAIGMLQMISILFSSKIGDGFRWLRTKTNTIASEATVADYMRKTIFLHCPTAPVIDIIMSKQMDPQDMLGQDTA